MLALGLGRRLRAGCFVRLSVTTALIGQPRSHRPSQCHLHWGRRQLCPQEAADAVAPWHAFAVLAVPSPGLHGGDQRQHPCTHGRSNGHGGQRMASHQWPCLMDHGLGNQVDRRVPGLARPPASGHGPQGQPGPLQGTIAFDPRRKRLSKRPVVTTIGRVPRCSTVPLRRGGRQRHNECKTRGLNASDGLCHLLSSRQGRLIGPGRGSGMGSGVVHVSSSSILSVARSWAICSRSVVKVLPGSKCLTRQPK